VELAHLLAAFAEVKIVATKAARHFIQEHELPAAAQPIHGKAPVLCSHTTVVSTALRSLLFMGSRTDCTACCCNLCVVRLALLIVQSRCS